MGKTDKIIRVILGAGVIGWGVVSQNWLGAVGLVALITALISFCPLYPIFKINTGCKRNVENAEG